MLWRHVMNITVIDGQGGQLGAQLVKEITSRFPDIQLFAIGTNAVATATMKKAGAKYAATGENPVIVACRKANVIIGPLGIVVADSLLGEITPGMAVAIGQANAVRILLPMNKCDNLIAGVGELNVKDALEDAVTKLQAIVDGRNR